MSYLHIDNLYRSKDILLFKECYAMEKIHGTSAHLTFKQIEFNTWSIIFFSGGEKYNNFVSLFNEEELIRLFLSSKFVGANEVTIFGEAYGGKQQGMSATYGKELKFVAFEVSIGARWLNVPDAEALCKFLGIEFVHYDIVSTDITILDSLANAPSVQAKRNGIMEDKLREGIVLRPLIELTKNNGARIIAKHKNEAFKERQHQPKLDIPQLQVYDEAKKIAEEFVTEMRLSHVLDKFGDLDISKLGDIIRAMIEDVEREAKGEILENHEVRKAIGKRTVELFKMRLKNG